MILFAGFNSLSSLLAINNSRRGRNFLSTSFVTQAEEYANKNTPPSSSSDTKTKPNLKQVGRFGRSRLVVFACVLVTIYMYPMIFRPLLGFGPSAEETMKILKQTGVDSSKTRPSFMPRWTSPFGPKGAEDIYENGDSKH